MIKTHKKTVRLIGIGFRVGVYYPSRARANRAVIPGVQPASVATSVAYTPVLSLACSVTVAVLFTVAQHKRHLQQQDRESDLDNLSHFNSHFTPLQSTMVLITQATQEKEAPTSAESKMSGATKLKEEKTSVFFQNGPEKRVTQTFTTWMQFGWGS